MCTISTVGINYYNRSKPLTKDGKQHFQTDRMVGVTLKKFVADGSSHPN